MNFNSGIKVCPSLILIIRGEKGQAALNLLKITSMMMSCAFTALDTPYLYVCDVHCSHHFATGSLLNPITTDGDKNKEAKLERERGEGMRKKNKAAAAVETVQRIFVFRIHLFCQQHVTFIKSAWLYVTYIYFFCFRCLPLLPRSLCVRLFVMWPTSFELLMRALRWNTPFFSLSLALSATISNDHRPTIW